MSPASDTIIRVLGILSESPLVTLHMANNGQQTNSQPALQSPVPSWLL